ncbi:MAG: uncharacterized protein JWR37_5736 [Mycobacterium sp.]|nr:uncharacterized protein [Mycobacterium sp.]
MSLFDVGQRCAQVLNGHVDRTLDVVFTVKLDELGVLGVRNKAQRTTSADRQPLLPAAKTVSKVREGATVTKKYDRACTPYARAVAHPDIKALPRRLTSTRRSFNPAAVQRQIQALYDELLTLATAKNQPTGKPQVHPAPTRTFPDEATIQTCRTY